MAEKGDVIYLVMFTAPYAPEDEVYALFAKYEDAVECVTVANRMAQNYYIESRELL